MSQIFEEEAILNISLTDDYKEIRNYSVAQVKKDILDRLSEIQSAEFSWEPPATGNRFSDNNFEGGDEFAKLLGIGIQSESVIIKGNEFDIMLNQANDIKYYLSQLSSIEEAEIYVPGKRPELMLNFDKQMMATNDLNLISVTNQLNTFQNEFTSGAKLKQGTEEYDIIIKTNS